MSEWREALRREYEAAARALAAAQQSYDDIFPAAKGAGLVEVDRRRYRTGKGFTHAIREIMGDGATHTVSEIRERVPGCRHVSGILDALKRAGEVKRVGLGVWQATESGR